MAWQEYLKKNNSKTKLNLSKFFFFLFLLYLSPSIFNGVKDYIECVKTLEKLKNKKASLEREVKELREIAYNLDDPYIIEKIAREKLFMVRPGEEPILIIEKRSPK
ncbi:MAG: FtsB family cell division protein [Dictyoglomus sp.]